MTRNSQQTETGWNSTSDYEFGGMAGEQSDLQREDINPEDNHTLDVEDDPERGANANSVF